jgi:hypothetical protein
VSMICKVVERPLRRTLYGHLCQELPSGHFVKIVAVRWTAGRVEIDDSVAMPNAVTGKALEASYWADIHALTLGLVSVQDKSLRVGPVELIRFGRPKVTRTSVQWPIEGGLLTRSPGGHLRFEAQYGRLIASVEGYQPALPRLLYVLAQVPVHHLLTRLHLLRVRGRLPATGVTADPSRRRTAAAIDVGLCLALAGAMGRRRRVPFLLGIAACYHLACWTFSGRTLGGAVMKQRVVSVDGSGLSAGQALVRLVSLPLAFIRRRNAHDEMAGTDVLADTL